MTLGTKNNVYIVGARKDPAKPIPVVSKERIGKAVEATVARAGRNKKDAPSPNSEGAPSQSRHAATSQREE